MPRPRYTITEDDFQHAYFYLSDKVRTFKVDYVNDGLLSSPEREFVAVTKKKTSATKAVALNAWCEKYLSSAEWTKLKAGIRKRRERWEHHGQQKTLTVSSTVHSYLAKIAERDGVTYNEILEEVLYQTWRSSRRFGGRSIARQTRRKK
jgi:macrodomain Ter protein organizer (MatP/YcbG family)